MNSKYLFLATALVALPAAAQETYENAKIADEDLNGTARYVGMGGAMEALGADISTISSNPAGIGLIRHSQVSLSGSTISQGSAENWATGDKTHASFDQAGFVINLAKGRKNNFNVGFNYHKSKNFDFILSATNTLSGASQGKLTYEKLRNGLVYDNSGNACWTCNQLDGIYANNILYDSDDQTYYYDEASSYRFNREHTGYIGAYDFNVSGNVGSQFYWGLTFGIKDVHYKGDTQYTEDLTSGYALSETDEREITGTGFDIKAGIIVRPVAESPFRIGAYIHTPTFYDLTTSNYTTAYLPGYGTSYGGRSSESYDFKLYTPWKFGISLGHTVGNYLALGATYEYADYGTLDTRIIDGGYYDYYYDTYYDTSSSDEAMNRHTKQTLKGVSTLKLGVEVKPAQNFAIRLGYNYVSPKYSEDGYKDVTVNSPGSYYASQTDYTNWKSTNRFTLGLGYTLQKFTIDLAYQYSAQKGEFSPFTSYEERNTETGELTADTNYATTTDVKNNRSQLLLTLGYHF